jgi:hypothetical protein
MQSDVGALIFAEPVGAQLTMGRRIVVLIVVHVPVIAMAMTMPNIRPVLEIGGALGGCLCDFVFPPLLSLWLNKADGVRTPDWSLVIFIVLGTMVACISTYEAVLDAIDLMTHD